MIPSTVPRTAVVLGAGGLVGQAFHLGVLTALEEVGFDARRAHTLVGTSAGSLVAAGLGAGLSASALRAELRGGARGRGARRGGGPGCRPPTCEPSCSARRCRRRGSGCVRTVRSTSARRRPSPS